MTAADRSVPKLNMSQWLLLVTGFLAALWGGYVINDATSSPSGLTEMLSRIAGGSDLPLLTHALIAMPLLLALGLSLIRHRVLQVPKQVLSLLWMCFFVFLGASTLFSAYRALSMELWLEWVCFGCALFGAVSLCGRRTGAKALLASIAAGTFAVAVNGILEYKAMRVLDPSARIFAGWVNPNATAAMLALGFFVAVGLCLSQSRLQTLLAGIAAALIAAAMVLTGSKGAVSLALPIGFLALGLFNCRATPRAPLCWFIAAALALAIGGLFLKNVGWIGLILGILFASGSLRLGSNDGVGALRVIGCALGCAAILVLLNLTTPNPQGSGGAPAATPMARISQGSQTQEQSSEFRLNLWRSAAFLIKERPLQGFGLGSYRNESARAGLTTSTVFSHNVYLQLWSEAGIGPFVLFISAILLWLRSIFRGREQTPLTNLNLSGGVVAAVVALATHGLVDSDLSYFGIGIVFFFLLGVGLNLASDAVAPELIQLPVRRLAVALCFGISLLLVVFGRLEVEKANVRYDLTQNDLNSLKEHSADLNWASGLDGDATYLQAKALIRTGSPQEEFIPVLRQAFNLFPSEKIGRMLATGLSGTGKTAEALRVLKEALERDPKNLSSLSLLMKIESASGDAAGAEKAAETLVSVEKSPYFKIRSIPESIPTETFDARLDVLAPNAQNPSVRAQFLSEAVSGYVAYVKTTLPIVREFAKKQGGDANFRMPGYDSLDDAVKKIQSAIDGGVQAIAIYRKIGEPEAAAAVEANVSALRAAVAA